MPTPKSKQLPTESVNQLLKNLKNQGIQLWVEENRLRYRAPSGALTPVLRELIVTHKPDLIRWLSQSSNKPLPKEAKVVSPLKATAVDPSNSSFPLTDLQQAYALGRNSFFELGNVSAHYYTEIEVQDLDVARLEQAFNQLIRRHQALQSIIIENESQQLVSDKLDYQIKVVDLREQEPSWIESHLTEERQRFADHGPSLDTWPLFEILVHRLDEHVFHLHFNISLAIADGFSLTTILLPELFSLYYGSVANLATLELSYRDYEIALAQHKSSTDYRQSRQYWWQRIDSLPTAPELPLAKQPSALDFPQFKRWSDRLEPEQWQRLQRKAAAYGIKPSTLLCSAYASILNAWTKNDSFCLNILFFNRLPIHPDVRRIIGNFSSTILLEVDFTQGADFATQAQSIQQQLWQDMEYTAISGVEVLGELNRRQGGASRAAMPVTFASLLGFDRINNSQNKHTAAQKMQEEWVFKGSRLQTPFVFLDHMAVEDRGALVLNWDVVEAVFPPGLIQDMFTTYCQFLKKLADQDSGWQQRPQFIPVAQLESRQQINTASASTTLPKQTLQGLFQEQAQRHPQQTAIIAPRGNFTYEQLDHYSTQVGRWLCQKGAAVNQQIAIVMEKGAEQAIAALAILKSGAAYLPIEPTLPPERLTYLLNNSDVSLVLTQSWVETKIHWAENVKRYCVDTVVSSETEVSESELIPLSTLQSPQDLAYVIYTSGSTGKPKGVMIDHQGAVNTILDVNRRFDIQATDRVFAISSLSFDLSVYDLFGTFAAGATLIFPAAESIRDPAHWSDVILREQVTVWNSAPPLMKLLVETAAGRSEWFPKSLRRVLLSGDWIPLNLPSQLQTLIPDVQVISLGGATEASIWSIFYPIDQVDPTWKSVPYGRPLANQTFHVLNDHLDPCPTWVSGQLFIGGLGLSQGYWQNPEKTQSSFIEHPQLGRLYRTGDLGRYQPDGLIEFLGREDFQVKVRGYRIELGEIESALIQHQDLQAVVVMAVVNNQEEKQLVVYGVPELNSSASPADLRQFLQAKLPDYMIPDVFMFLEALPLTPNGKLDRKALPKPTTSRVTHNQNAILPSSPLEKELAALWQEVLGLQSVGIADNFFELGGTSISAVRLMTQVQTRYSDSLPLSTLFQQNTIEQLAQVVEQQNTNSSWSPLVPIQPEGHKFPFFCIHPVGGNVFCYGDLVRYLDRDRPFYGLQAVGLDPQQSPVTRIEDMARQYIDAIKTLQPQGPYLLGGWSFAVIVAYEMAQQLQQKGEEIYPLIAIDCAVPDRNIQFDEAFYAAWFIKDLQGQFDLDLEQLAQELRSLSSEQQFNQIFTQAQKLNLVSPEDGQSQIHSLYQVFKANLNAMYQYVPQCYEKDLVLLRAEQQPKQEKLLDLGWGELVSGNLTTCVIPGNHYTVFQEPHLQGLAQKLQFYLNQ